MNTPADAFSRLTHRFRVWGGLVKFSHSVFALPFALSMLLIAGRSHPVSSAQFCWILAAVVAARTTAMAFNRIIDRRIDAQNPRTWNRELPRGDVSMGGALFLLFGSSGIFLLSAAALGWHCLVLAPLVLFVLLGYSLTKRFTSLSHVVLGIALALAPGGVWYALTAEWSFLPVWMMLGVLCWVAGFDILYSCQDVEFDSTHALFSIPSRFGIARAFVIARLLHVLAVLFLVVFGFSLGLGGWYWLGLAVFAIILASQYRLISPESLSRIDAAFFTRNGCASIIYFIAVAMDTFVRTG